MKDQNVSVNSIQIPAEIVASVAKTISKNVEQQQDKFRKKQVSAGVKLILEGLGVDLDDPNFKDTPKRVARAYREFCAGLYNTEKSATEILGKHFPCKEASHDEMIFIGPVRAVGVCPHHLLPVEMYCYMSYIPKGFVVGLSKLARFIKLMASRPVLQEDLAKDIVDGFMTHVHPEGVALLISARHGCMAHRGVYEPDSSVDTIALRGNFRDESSLKEEFYAAISRRIDGKGGL